MNTGRQSKVELLLIQQTIARPLQTDLPLVPPPCFPLFQLLNCHNANLSLTSDTLSRKGCHEFPTMWETCWGRPSRRREREHRQRLCRGDASRWRSERWTRITSVRMSLRLSFNKRKSLRLVQSWPWRSKNPSTPHPCSSWYPWHWSRHQRHRIEQLIRPKKSPRRRQQRLPPWTWRIPPWNWQLGHDCRCHQKRGRGWRERRCDWRLCRGLSPRA